MFTHQFAVLSAYEELLTFGARNLYGRYAIDGSATGKEKHVTECAGIVQLKNGMITFLHRTLNSGYEIIASDKNITDQILFKVRWLPIFISTFDFNVT